MTDDESSMSSAIVSSATVETATGSVAVSQLGQTLMHEHVFVLNTEYMLNYPETWGDVDQVIARAVAELDEAAAHGVDTIVDLTVLGLGRMIPWVQRVAAQARVKIIIATGVYVFAELPLLFAFRGPGTILGGSDPMTELFIRDIREGVDETGVRAAILKCATDEFGVTPPVERVLRAVADAHLETGVPISTHTHAVTRRGLDQQRVFAKAGVDLSNVIIGHSGDTTDLEYLEEVIANGSYVGMDRFGFDGLVSFDDRVRMVAELCGRGYANRIVLSHDASCHNAWLDDEVKQVLAPNLRFTHISDDVLPALRRHGVSDEDIEMMLVHNPRTIFSPQSV
jgi:phosphotriesterase-related protein